jgi:hypothetical protein
MNWSTAAGDVEQEHTGLDNLGHVRAALPIEIRAKVTGVLATRGGVA